MRHRVFGRKLNRDIKERKALFKSLIIALISHGKIRTSLAKAKAIQRIADKIVTKAKDGSEVAVRQVSAFLTKKEVINKLVHEIAPRFKKTPGGYLRVRRTGRGVGDASEKVILEWSVAEEKKPEEKKPVKLEEKKIEKAKKEEKKPAPKKPEK